MKPIIKRIGMLFAALMAFLPLSAYDFDFEADGIYYNIVSSADHTCEVTRGTLRYIGEIVIPEKVIYDNDEFTVVAIGEKGFNGCPKVTSVQLPKSTTSIGNRAFYNISGLSQINLPEKLTTIGESAFYRCSSLKEITLPESLTSIGDRAFSRCDSIKTIKIPDSVTFLGYGAFEKCIALEDIKLGNLLNTLNYSTFKNCTSLSSLTIPGNIDTLILWGGFRSDALFCNCFNLKDMTIEYSINKLEAAFRNYNGDEHTDYSTDLTFGWMDFNNDGWLEDVPSPIEKFSVDRELSNDITLDSLRHYTIGEHIIKNQVNLSKSESLDTIISLAIVPPALDSLTANQYMNVIVMVPAESLDAYKSAETWKNFMNIEGFGPGQSIINTIDSDLPTKIETGRYDLQGRRVNEDYKGIAIIKYSDGSARKVVSGR